MTELEGIKLDKTEINVSFTDQGTIDKLKAKLKESQAEVDNLNKKIAQLEGTVEDLKNQLGNAKSVEFVRQLQEQLDEATQRIKMFRQKAQMEFDAMLSGSGLELGGGYSAYATEIDEEYERLVNRIKNGSTTAIEAMTNLKSQFADVWGDIVNGSSGGTIDSTALYQMSTTLQQVSASLTSMATQLSDVFNKVNSIVENGVSVSGQVSTSSENATSGMRQETNAANDLANTFKQLQDVINGFNATEQEAYSSITQFVQSVSEIGNLDANRLESLRQSFRAIASIAENKLPNFSGLKNFLSSVDTIPDTSKLSALSSVNLQGLNGVKVDSKTLEALATYLPQIGNGNYDSLNKLSGVDFSKLVALNDIKVNSNSISSLTSGLKALGEANADSLKSIADVKWENLASLKSVKGDIFTGLKNLSAKLDNDKIANLDKLSHLDWTNLSGFKVNKSAVDNLNDISLSDKKVANLEKLAGINWSNLTNFSMSKATSENILALSNIKDQLESLQKAVANGAGGSGGGGGSKSGIADVNNYNSAMGELVRTTTEVSTATNALVRSQYDYENAITKTKTSIKGGVITKVVDEKAIANEKMSVEQIEAAAAKAQEAITKLSVTLDKANTASGTLGPIAGVDAVESAINKFQYLIDNVKSGTMTNGQYADEFNQIAAAANVASSSIDAQVLSAKRLDEVNRQLEKSNKAEADSVKAKLGADSSYLNSLRNLLNLQQQMFKNNGAYNTDGSETTLYQNLAAAIDVLDQAYRNIAADGTGIEQFNTAVSNTGNTAKQVSVQIDLLKNATSQLDGVDKLITSVTKYNGDTTALNDYKNEINALIQSLANGKADITTFNTELEQLKSKYTNAAQAARDFVEANKGSTSQASQLKALENDATSYIGKLNALKAQLQNVSGGDTSQWYAEVEAALKSLSTVDHSNLDAFKQAVDAVKTSFAALKVNVDKFTGDTNKDLNQVAGQFEKVENGVAKLENNLAKTNSSFDGAAYAELTNRLSALKATMDNIKSSAGTNGYDATAVANLAKEYDDLANAIDKYAIGARNAASEESKKEASTRRAASAMKELLNYQSQAQKFLQDSTAAQTGSTADNYIKIQQDVNALEQLRMQYTSTQMGADEFAARVAALTADIKQNENVIQSAGEATMSFGDRIKKVASNFSYFFSTSRLIMTAIREIKQMFSYANEIDEAMAQLKIVTGATDSEMEKFSETAVNLSKNLGKSVTDLTSTIETFSRLGYSLSESSELSKFATILSNVASVDIDESTTGLTSIIKGFGLEYTDVEHVADVLVDVGQKYAVSASEIMEAFEKSSAALSATGVSLEQSAGLIAAGKMNARRMCKHTKEMA